MGNLRKAVVILILLFTTLSFSVYAANEPFKIESYFVDVDIQKDRSYQITETIYVSFEKGMDSFVRTIDLSGYMEAISVENIQVENLQFETVERENFVEIIISGEENEAFQGRNKFIITYTLRQYKDYYSDRDYMFLHVMDTRWNVTVDEARISLKLPGSGLLLGHNVFKNGEVATATDVQVQFTGEKLSLRTKKPLKPMDYLDLDITLKENTFNKAEVKPVEYEIGGLNTLTQFSADGFAKTISKFDIHIKSDEVATIPVILVNQDAAYAPLSVENIAVDTAEECPYTINRFQDKIIVEFDAAGYTAGDTINAVLSYDLSVNAIGDKRSEYVFFYSPVFNTVCTDSTLTIDIAEERIPYLHGIKPYLSYLNKSEGSDRLTMLSNERTYYFEIRTASGLLPLESVQCRVDFPLNTLYRPQAVSGTTILILAGIGIAAAILLLFAYGRLRKIKLTDQTLVLPEGLTPLDAGYIFHLNVGGTDIAAQIFAWAEQGYLKIVRLKNKRFVLKKLSPLKKEAKAAEKELFNALFVRRDEIEINKDGYRMYQNCFKAIRKIKNNLKRKLEKPVTAFLRITLALYGFAVAILPLLYTHVQYEENIFRTAVYVVLIILPAYLVYLASSKLIFSYKKASRMSYLGYFLFSIVGCAVVLYNTYRQYYFMPNESIALTAMLILIVITIPVILKSSPYRRKSMAQYLSVKASLAKVTFEDEADSAQLYALLPYCELLDMWDLWAAAAEGITTGYPKWFIDKVSLQEADAYTVAAVLEDSLITLAHCLLTPPPKNSTFSGVGDHKGFRGGGFSEG